jgi:hypothetical protein
MRLAQRAGRMERFRSPSTRGGLPAINGPSPIYAKGVASHHRHPYSDGNAGTGWLGEGVASERTNDLRREVRTLVTDTGLWSFGQRSPFMRTQKDLDPGRTRQSVIFRFFRRSDSP